MKKKMKILTSLVLSALILSSATLTAFSDTLPLTATVEVETQACSKENVTVNVTEDVTTSDGSINTKTTQTVTGFVTEDGMIVDFESESDMTSDAMGIVTGTASSEYTSKTADGVYTAEGGSETTIEWVPFTLPSQITIPLTSESGLNIATVSSDTYDKTITFGDDQDVSDGIYDYGSKTSHSGGQIVAQCYSAIGGQTAVSNGATNLNHLYASVVPDGENELIVGSGNISLVKEDDDGNPIYLKDITGEYDHIYVGEGPVSHFWPAKVLKTEDANGVVYTAKDGTKYYAGAAFSRFVKRSLFLHRLYDKGEWVEYEDSADYHENRKGFYAQYSSAEQFILMDKKGNFSTHYCADALTNTQWNYLYRMENLEDSTYYDPAMAKHIRSIALNGYWGTEGSDLGSLYTFKQGLIESGKFTQAEIDRITNGIAQTATQIAIWRCSNHMHDIEFVGVYDADESRYLASNNQRLDENGKNISNEASKEDSALIYKIIDHLSTLSEEKTDINTGNTVINAKNFLATAGVNIKDVTGETATTDVEFSLKVRPRSNKDSLLVTITDGEGNVLAKGRVAGTVGEGEIDLRNNIRDGEYCFSDINLKRGEVNNIKFHMTGWQEMDNGVYLYTSEVIDGLSSQTLVGIANGPRDVNVDMQLQFTLDIQDELLETQHVYRRERITPLAIEDSVSGTKTLNGNPAGGYKFQLLDETSAVIAEATSDDNGNFTFDPIEFEEAGTFTYTVREAAGDDEFTIYDDSVFTVTYEVELQGRELVIVSKTITKGDETANAIEFANIKYEPATASVSGKKVFKNHSLKGFTFSLADENGTEIATATSNRKGVFAFNNIEFRFPGTYTYTITEKAGSNKKIVYDKTVYEVVFTVTEENYVLSVSDPVISIVDGDTRTPVTAISFTNTSKTTPPPSATPTPTPPSVTPPPEVPDTGDINSIWPFALCASLAAVVAIVVIKRKADQ